MKHAIHPDLLPLARPVAELEHDPDNARVHPERNLKAIEASYVKHGQRRPLVAQRKKDGRIVVRAGNGQLSVVRNRLGWSHVAVVVVDEDDAEALEFALRDNRSAELAEWGGNLGSLLDSLPDPTDLGWEPGDLSHLVPELHDVGAHKRRSRAASKPKTAEELGDPEPPAIPRAELGDLWKLGRHFLAVADALSEDNLRRLLEKAGGRADAVFTDPPYAVYGSSTGIASDITDDKLVRPFFRDVVRQCVRASKPFAHVYLCCDWRSWASWWEVAKGTGLAPKNMVVWDKGGGLGSMYANAHELIFFGSIRPLRKGMSQKISGERPAKGKNIWRIERAGRKETDGERQHNAQKPIELVAKALEVSTDPGALVVDFFLGSGTTLVAAEQLGRRCVGFEIAPRFADLVITRWEKETGETAERFPGYFDLPGDAPAEEEE